MNMLRYALIVATLVAVAMAACGGSSGTFPQTALAPALRERSLFDHVSVVMMENHDYRQIIGNTQAPYINNLASTSALFTDSHAVTHPSLPNYLAIFSGSTQRQTADNCPVTFSKANLGSELVASSKTIKGYFEELPSVGSTVCSSDEYRRDHNPAIDFTTMPSTDVVPYTQLTGNLAGTYPTVAFIVPDTLDDMHDGTIAQGDAWCANNLPAIIAYDLTHNGLLILTWDENDRTPGNHIVTIFVGPMVQPGRYSQSIDHYNVLRTLTDGFKLSPLTSAPGITGVWR